VRQPFLFMNNEDYMHLALKEADKAWAIDEVPVGALIVKDGKIIARAHNRRETTQRATAHAELLAIEKACKKLKSWRLDGCILVVTLEPCAMCTGASLLSRVDGIVFGAYDPKGGCMGTVTDLTTIKAFNHQPWVMGGVLETVCAQRLTEFFKNKRKAPTLP
jgi:tRNA(adenine34) deaminase